MEQTPIFTPVSTEIEYREDPGSTDEVIIGETGLSFIRTFPDMWEMHFVRPEIYNETGTSSEMSTMLRSGAIFYTGFIKFLEFLRSQPMLPRKVYGETNKRMHDFLRNLFERLHVGFVSGLVPPMGVTPISSIDDLNFELQIDLAQFFETLEFPKVFTRYRDVAIDRGYVVPQ